jgi:hypothetical protein
VAKAEDVYGIVTSSDEGVVIQPENLVIAEEVVSVITEQNSAIASSTSR